MPQAAPIDLPPFASSASIPKPGEIFDPVARALDLVGDRWTLVLVRHLLAGPRGFQALRQLSGIAPRVLSARLRKLIDEGWVERENGGVRAPYRVTDKGRTLEPIISAAARWWVDHAMEDRGIDTTTFTETSAQSILESLPFLLRKERAAGVRVTFEIRLRGDGGGVWTVRIDDGSCVVGSGFAEVADVRYTADARVWCAIAVGQIDARDAMARGSLSKEGARDALDDYFVQIPRGGAAS